MPRGPGASQRLEKLGEIGPQTHFAGNSGCTGEFYAEMDLKRAGQVKSKIRLGAGGGR
jgi:hypothetical protein